MEEQKEYLLEINFEPKLYLLHRSDCPVLPCAHIRDYFGAYPSDAEAIKALKSLNLDTRLCAKCLNTYTRKTHDNSIRP